MPRLPRRPQDVDAPPAGTWPGPEAERAAALPLQPLANGGFETGLEQWDKANPQLVQIKTGDAAAGAKYLTITTDNGAELHRKLSGLQPGRAYQLVFHSRRNTSRDARIIIRDLANQHYLANSTPSPGQAWQKSTLRFTAPAAEVGLEISLRAAGGCDLDEFVLLQGR
jgi:hypothetical protein